MVSIIINTSLGGGGRGYYFAFIFVQKDLNLIVAGVPSRVAGLSKTKWHEPALTSAENNVGRRTKVVCYLLHGTLCVIPNILLLLLLLLI